MDDTETHGLEFNECMNENQPIDKTNSDQSTDTNPSNLANSHSKTSQDSLESIDPEIPLHSSPKVGRVGETSSDLEASVSLKPNPVASTVNQDTPTTVQMPSSSVLPLPQVSLHENPRKNLHVENDTSIALSPDHLPETEKLLNSVETTLSSPSTSPPDGLSVTFNSYINLTPAVHLFCKFIVIIH